MTVVVAFLAQFVLLCSRRIKGRSIRSQHVDTRVNSFAASKLFALLLQVNRCTQELSHCYLLAWDAVVSVDVHFSQTQSLQPTICWTHFHFTRMRSYFVTEAIILSNISPLVIVFILLWGHHYLTCEPIRDCLSRRSRRKAIRATEKARERAERSREKAEQARIRELIENDRYVPEGAAVSRSTRWSRFKPTRLIGWPQAQRQMQANHIAPPPGQNAALPVINMDPPFGVGVVANQPPAALPPASR